MDLWINIQIDRQRKRKIDRQIDIEMGRSSDQKK